MGVGIGLGTCAGAGTEAVRVGAKVTWAAGATGVQYGLELKAPMLAPRDAPVL